MERNPVIPPNFVTLRDLKERRDREQMLKLQRSIQVEKEEESEVKGPLIAPVHRKEEESEVKGPLIAPVHRKEEEKEEGSFDNIPPKPRKYTNQNHSRGMGPRRQSATINAKAVADGSTTNAWKKKESSAEVANVITEMPITGRNYASEAAMGEKRTKATTALVNGGKRGGHLALDIERRISGLQINGRNSNPLRRGKKIGGGRGYGNYWRKSSNSEGKVWVVKKSLHHKDDGAGKKRMPKGNWSSEI